MTLQGDHLKTALLRATAAMLAASCCLLNGCGTTVNSVQIPSSQVTAVSNGPQLGYLWMTADKSLRPILGIPGASLFGQSIVTPGAYGNGAASVRSSLALLQSASGALSLMAVPQGTPQLINGASVGGTAQIVFSPSGLNAIVYSSGAASTLLLTGLNATPQVQTLSAPSSLQAAAVSDTAQVVGVYGSGTLTVALLTGSRTPLTSLSGFGGLGFLPGGSDLLLADKSTGVLTLLRNTASAPAMQSFTATSIQSPVAVAASADGVYAVVANGGDPSVVRIDLSGASVPVRIGCACQPAQLTPLSGNAVFGLTALSSGPMWVADASAATPRTVFIPAVTP